eukprot:GHUV01005518.1.p1 GENE.GHUV01005518.1~~GHUV01005518.1.p1  ORF type:complete len:467 (+),score=193.09 GHUV01005518.1:456-1856(+)
MPSYTLLLSRPMPRCAQGNCPLLLSGVACLLQLHSVLTSRFSATCTSLAPILNLSLHRCCCLQSGKCARGDACPYSHGVFEQWLHPSRFRTQLCSFGSACRRPICFFAHSVNELRVPTACGPNAGAACSPSPALLAGAYTDPSVAALAAAAAATAGRTDATQAAALQQALLTQMNQAVAMQQLDGPTATMINRYQAASCAALANAAACQRQQQQHQAAAAAAAAAAMAAAANSSPASLLQMAQAAQAYQAAAAAAAAAAANVTFPHHHQQAQQMIGTTPQGSSNVSSSSASSPTSSSNNYSLASVSTYLTDPQDRCNPADLPMASSAMVAAAAAAGSQGLYDSLILQQALAAAKATSNGLQIVSPVSGGPGGLMNSAPWALPASLPAASGSLVGSAFGSVAAGGYGCGANSLMPNAGSLMHTGSGNMPQTPDLSDGSVAGFGGSCGSLDALANHLSRQLSLGPYQA